MYSSWNLWHNFLLNSLIHLQLFSKSEIAIASIPIDHRPPFVRACTRKPRKKNLVKRVYFQVFPDENYKFKKYRKAFSQFSPVIFSIGRLPKHHKPLEKNVARHSRNFYGIAPTISEKFVDSMNIHEFLS